MPRALHERATPFGDLLAQKGNMRGTRALCGERRRQVEDDAAGIPLVVVGVRRDIEFDFGRMVVAAARCTHLVRNRKVRHMEAMAARTCSVRAFAPRTCTSGRSRAVPPSPCRRAAATLWTFFNFIYPSTIPHSARDPPPGIFPGRVGMTSPVIRSNARTPQP